MLCIPERPPAPPFGVVWCRRSLQYAPAVLLGPPFDSCLQNHLDLHAVLWLEEYLESWPNTVVIVSHAREFLNATCTDIIHLHNEKLEQYRGNFAAFLGAREEKLANASKAAEAQTRRKEQMQQVRRKEKIVGRQHALPHLLPPAGTSTALNEVHKTSDPARGHPASCPCRASQFIDKFRFNAKRASLVQSRIKALDRMSAIDLEVPEAEVNFKFPMTDAGEIDNVVSFSDVSFNYPKAPTIFSNVSFGIDSKSRIALVGANGAGMPPPLNLLLTP